MYSSKREPCSNIPNFGWMQAVGPICNWLCFWFLWWWPPLHSIPLVWEYMEGGQTTPWIIFTPPCGANFQIQLQPGANKAPVTLWPRLIVVQGPETVSYDKCKIALLSNVHNCIITTWAEWLVWQRLWKSKLEALLLNCCFCRDRSTKAEHWAMTCLSIEINCKQLWQLMKSAWSVITEVHGLLIYLHL